jgi:hypothetical protein
MLTGLDRFVRVVPQLLNLRISTLKESYGVTVDLLSNS